MSAERSREPVHAVGKDDADDGLTPYERKKLALDMEVRDAAVRTAVAAEKQAALLATDRQKLDDEPAAKLVEHHRQVEAKNADDAAKMGPELVQRWKMRVDLEECGPVDLIIATVSRLVITANRWNQATEQSEPSPDLVDAVEQAQVQRVDWVQSDITAARTKLLAFESAKWASVRKDILRTGGSGSSAAMVALDEKIGKDAKYAMPTKVLAPVMRKVIGRLVRDLVRSGVLTPIEEPAAVAAQ